MRIFQSFPVPKGLNIKKNLVAFGKEYNNVCVLDSNEYKQDRHSSYEFLMGLGAKSQLTFQAHNNCFDALKKFHTNQNDWLFGFLSYDLKNEIENLHSENFDNLKMSLMHFYVPELLFIISDNILQIGFHSDSFNSGEIEQLFTKIIHHKPLPGKKIQSPEIKPRILKKDYFSAFQNIMDHIQCGDVYELNLCQEFYAENAITDPLDIYHKLIELSPAPFSAYLKINDRHLLCASPERFLKKSGTKIISQPIKGTIRRGNGPDEDFKLKEQLRDDPKEQSENVMIVDLVRNDLSRTAKKSSVKVEELFGIYSFSNVHQMISTITSELREDVHFTEAIKYAFPMGSMTGAPKIRTMELIEKYEKTKRGLYSGAVGYITPDGDFDFNVVIRSILYNETQHYLSFIVGGAITANAIAEKEYEECLLKAKAIFQSLTIE